MLDEPTAAGILEQMYQVLLNRVPDNAGFQSHLATLRAGPFPEAFGRLLLAFIQGPEAELAWRRRFYSKELGRVYELYQTDLADVEFASLGSHCYTSWILKIAGLKKASGPFDWLFSSAAMISEVLDDDFHDFLDKKYYQTVPEQERKFSHANKCHHELYRSKFGIDYVFNHRDPNEIIDYEYLKKCVERFREKAKIRQRTIFIHTARACAQTEDAFLTLSHPLKNTSRTPDCYLLPSTKLVRPYQTYELCITIVRQPS